MSERWPCRACYGKGILIGNICHSCYGTGGNGCALDYEVIQLREDVHVAAWGWKLNEVRRPSQRMEDHIYKTKYSHAMELAIQACEKRTKEIQMKFQDVKNEAGGGIDTKHFVKLKDGEKVAGVFRGDPHIFRQHWMNNRSSLCTGTSCELCAQKNKSTFRFRINLVTYNAPEKKFEAKVFEQAYSTYETLKTLHESGYDLEKTWVIVQRKGTDKNTNYTILPDPRTKLTPAYLETIHKVELHDLANLGKTDKVETHAPPFGAFPDDGSAFAANERPPSAPFEESDLPF